MTSFYNQEPSFIGTRNVQQSMNFPKLPNSEILSCLTELGFAITKEELQKPEQHAAAIKGLLEFLAEVCLAITRDELTQPAFAGLNAINYPELHEESIPQLNSLRAIQKMMELCDIHDFSIRDLMTPDAKRLNRQLSGIMNFAKFREERLMLLRELSGTREELVEKLNAVREKHESLNTRLSNLRAQTAEEEALMSALNRDATEAETQVEVLQQQQKAYETQIKEKNDDYSKLKDNVVRAEEELEDLKNVHKR
jgi:kinetochore protein Nuf2